MNDKQVFLCAIEMMVKLTKADLLSQEEYDFFADRLDLCLAIAYAFAYGEKGFDGEGAFYQKWSPKARSLYDFKDNVERTLSTIDYYKHSEDMWPMLIGILENETGLGLPISSYEEDFKTDNIYKEVGEIIHKVIEDYRLEKRQLSY